MRLVLVDDEGTVHEVADEVEKLFVDQGKDLTEEELETLDHIGLPEDLLRDIALTLERLGRHVDHSTYGGV